MKKYSEFVLERDSNVMEVMNYVNKIKELKPLIDLTTLFESFISDLKTLIDINNETINIKDIKQLLNKYEINDEINCGTCEHLQEELNNIINEMDNEGYIEENLDKENNLDEDIDIVNEEFDDIFVNLINKLDS